MSALLLALALFPGIYLREASPQRDASQRVNITPIEFRTNSSHGPFTLTGAWELTSPDWRFGSYSALVTEAPGRLLAFGDQGYWLDLPQPGAGGAPAGIGSAFDRAPTLKQARDIEAAMRDPADGRIWLALEGRNAVAPLGKSRTIARLVQPAALRDWPENAGPEAAVRLADGRFLLVAESRAGMLDPTGHPAVLFDREPGTPANTIRRFELQGPSGYRPTDAALLPDGRVLMLFRRLVWPMPARFAIKLALLDPAAIDAGKPVVARELIALDDPWPVDNYEGLAIEPDREGKLTAWIISDANNAVTQRTLLLRLAFRLADLPPKAKGAQIDPRAPR